MGLLDNLATDDSITLDTDRVGGGFKLLDTDIYELELKFAYLSTSKGGAMALNIEAVTPDGDKVNQAIYMTSGTAKGCKNFYMDKEDKKQYLPGFVTCNSLALLATGTEIAKLETEEKTINLYDYDLKKEAPTRVQMFTELVGKTIKAAITKTIEDKRVKNDAGAYVPSGETREQNEITKFMRERDDMTVLEITSEAEEALFHIKWLEKNKGNCKDNSTKVAGSAGAPPPNKAAAGAPAKKSLFS